MTDVKLPPEVILATGKWLDDVEAALYRITNTAIASQTGEGLVVARAVDDALNATSHFRRVLASELPMNARPQVHHLRVGAIPVGLAVQISNDVTIATSIPEDMLDVAKRQLPADDVRPFLLLIGHVAGSLISDVAVAVWNAHPHLAPAGWAPSAEPRG
jgi:hypothetical protein